MHVDAICVRRVCDQIQVLFKSLGEWRLAIEVSADTLFSHTAERPALEAAPVGRGVDDSCGEDGREWVSADP